MRAQDRLSDPFDWLEAMPALLIVVLVLASVLPAWTMGIAVLVSIRPTVRLLGRAVSLWLDGV